MPEPRVLLGRYELRDLIGAGGSARVYRAHDRRLDRIVAVKLLDAAAAMSADPAAHDRFVREARTSAGFAHRHSVATYDAGDADGQLFLVMEYVEGPSLAHRIAAEAPMAEQDIVRIGEQVLDALAAAHASGLIHRDVKPANILLDSAGHAKLADFGIAKRLDELSESLTVAGMVIGTRDYLAPEQAAGAGFGPPADLYALGVVLYEMATGSRPGVTAGEPPDPRTLRPDLGPALATAIRTALSPQPRDRFTSAGAMAAALTGEVPPTALSLAEPQRSTPPTMAVPGGGPRSNRTEPMPGRPAAAGVGPTTALPMAVARPSRGMTARSILLPLVVAIVFVGVIVLAARDGDESAVAGEGAATTQTPTAATGLPATTAAPTTPTTPTTAPPTTPATTPPTTTPPTTPPSTAAPTTTPPTEPPVDELIPGFTATDDLDQFIDQLRDARDIAGKQARKLSDRLQDVRDEDDGEDRDERIQDLRDELDEWVGDDELHPVIAERTLTFLDDLD